MKVQPSPSFERPSPPPPSLLKIFASPPSPSYTHIRLYAYTPYTPMGLSPYTPTGLYAYTPIPPLPVWLAFDCATRTLVVRPLIYAFMPKGIYWREGGLRLRHAHPRGAAAYPP